MAKFLGRKFSKQILRTTWPALATLLATLSIAVLITEFTFTSGGNAFGVILWRFLSLLSNLSLPLFLLPLICTWVQKFLNWGSRQLVRVKEEEDAGFHAFQSWVIRPLQGIGLVMLMATHFLIPLGTYLGGSPAGSTIPAIPPPGELTLGRIINLAVTSLLLSFVWTMKDLGVRHYNRRTGEIRVVGKYLGSLLPILSGFYGVYSLFQDQPALVAVFMVVQRVVIFYPPLVVFTVLHRRYVNRYEPLLAGKLKALPGRVRVDPGESPPGDT